MLTLNPFYFQWIPELKHYAPGVPIILVGTKLGKYDYVLFLEIQPSVLVSFTMLVFDRYNTIIRVLVRQGSHFTVMFMIPAHEFGVVVVLLYDGKNIHTIKAWIE